MATKAASPKKVSTKSKVVTGGKKPPSNKKILLISLPVAALVLGAAWFGYKAYQENSIKAQAQYMGYISPNTTSPSITMVRMWACKESIISAYGPLWRVKIAGNRDKSTIKSTVLEIWRNGSLVSRQKSSLWAGYWNQVEGYASQLSPDVITLKYELSSASGMYTYRANYSVSNIIWC